MAELIVGGLTLSEDDRGRLHFWGEVFNLGKTTHRWIRVAIRLLGDGRKPVAEQDDILGLEWTMPDSRNPFHIRFLRPPERWQGYDIRLTEHPHDYDDPAVPQPHPGIEIAKLHFREIERADLRCSIIGLLSNTGSAPATRVKVAATLYSASGKVVGAMSPYLVPRGEFGPGHSVPFEVKFYAVGGPVANYDVQAQGRLQRT